MAQAGAGGALRHQGLRERIGKGAIAGTRPLAGHHRRVLHRELGDKEWMTTLLYLRYASAPSVFTESGYVDAVGAREMVPDTSPMLSVRACAAMSW